MMEEQKPGMTGAMINDVVRQQTARIRLQEFIEKEREYAKEYAMLDARRSELNRLRQERRQKISEGVTTYRYQGELSKIADEVAELLKTGRDDDMNSQLAKTFAKVTKMMRSSTTKVLYVDKEGYAYTIGKFGIGTRKPRSDVSRAVDSWRIDRCFIQSPENLQEMANGLLRLGFIDESKAVEEFGKVVQGWKDFVKTSGDDTKVVVESKLPWVKCIDFSLKYGTARVAFKLSSQLQEDEYREDEISASGDFGSGFAKMYEEACGPEELARIRAEALRKVNENIDALKKVRASAQSALGSFYVAASL